MQQGMMAGMNQQETETKKLKDIDKQVFRLFFAALRPYKNTLRLAMGAAMLVAAANIAAPALTAWAIDGFIIPKNAPGLTLVLLGYLLVYGVYWAASYISSYLTIKIGQNLVADVRKKLFHHISTLSMDYFSKSKTGDIVSRLSGDVNTLAEFVSSGLVNLAGDIATLVGIITVMFVLHPGLAAVVVITVPLILLGTSLLGRHMRKAYSDVRQITANLNAGVEDNLSGIRVVQASSRQSDNARTFEKLNRETMKANTKAILITALFFPFMSISGALGTALVVMSGSMMIAAGSATVGLLTAFLGYTNRFFIPLRDLSQIYNTYQTAAASSERIQQTLDIRPTVLPPKTPIDLSASGNLDVEFRDVSFAYEPKRKVIDSMNLIIPAGQTIAIVGPTGAGKSTVVKLLSRLYDVDAGAVTIGGVDVRDIGFGDLREAVMVVPQEVFLFAGTIMENIRYGKIEATDEQVKAAAKKACTNTFIEKLPNGYETQVGEGGAMLSGGQRQLIAFARAVLADRPILILDEATSSVDAATEDLIKEALDNLIKGRTTLMIAHRFTTLQKAQRTVVMESGQIVGFDTHENLMKTCTLYRELYEKQRVHV